MQDKVKEKIPEILVAEGLLRSFLSVIDVIESLQVPASLKTTIVRCREGVWSSNFTYEELLYLDFSI